MNTAKTCPQCHRPIGPEAIGGICPECLLKAGLGATTAFGEGGESAPLPPMAAIAPKFPQLEILECLGRGGMGVVYKARQPLLNRMVALKILAPEREKDPQFAARFAREAQALARLNHPNIVAVYDFGEADGLFYLLMEYVDGLSLRQVLQSGKIAPAEALGIVPRICEALQYAHEQGVVHRDIKPENVLLDRQGRVKIADFGVARILARPGEMTLTTRATQAMGTPYYMAPEQLERPKEVDHRADIYSLGVVFYEMLTGELPLGRFQTPSQKVRVDVRLDEVVLRALEKEPERRYQQASQVKTAVETIAGGGGGGAAIGTGAGATAAGRPAPMLMPQTQAGPRISQRTGLRGMTLALAFFGTFAVIFVGLMLYGRLATPLYQSTATVQVLRGTQLASVGGSANNDQVVATEEDFNTQVQLMESAAVAEAVASRLKPAERRRLLAPYGGIDNLRPQPDVEQILVESRTVTPVRMSLMMEVSYTHPDKEMAAQIANYFAEEFIAKNAREKADASMKMVEDLQLRADQQRKKAEEIRSAMNNMVEKYGINLGTAGSDERADELKAQSAIVTEDLRVRDETENRWQAVQQQQADKKPLWELSFIANDAHVAELLKEYADSKGIGALSPHLDLDPVLVAKQLDEAAASAVEIVHNDLQMAQSNLEQSQKRLEDLQQEIVNAAKIEVEYDSLQRDLDVADGEQKRIMGMVSDEQTKFNISTPDYRIVDYAGVPAEPVSSNLAKLLGLRVLTGLAGGVVATVIVAVAMMLGRRLSGRAKELSAN